MTHLSNFYHRHERHLIMTLAFLLLVGAGVWSWLSWWIFTVAVPMEQELVSGLLAEIEVRGLYIAVDPHMRVFGVGAASVAVGHVAVLIWLFRKKALQITTLVAVIMILASCSPSLSDKDLAMVKGAGDNATAASKSVAALQATVNTQAAQIAALQKQLAATSGNQTAFASKADTVVLQNAVNALNAGGDPADVKKRLAIVEGQSSTLNANFGVYRNELNGKLAGMQTTINTLAAMFQGSSPALAQLEVLRLQMVDVYARFAALDVKLAGHGW